MTGVAVDDCGRSRRISLGDIHDLLAEATASHTVSESLHGVREEHPAAADDAERQRIFFPHTLAQRTTQWERGDDPMTQFVFSDAYDSYGQPRSQISIAVPRGRDYRVAAPAGGPYLATQTVTDYTQCDDTQGYLTGQVDRTTSYEIINDGASSVVALHAASLEATLPHRLLGQTLNYYDGPAFQGLPLGELGDHGLLSRSESLVLTPDILQEAYKSGDTVQTPPELPPYLLPTGTPPWSADYPPAFRASLPPLAGYRYQPGSAQAASTTGYFIVTQARRYDYQSAPDGRSRGLVLATHDALGRETTVVYDVYDLLPIRVTDPAGLTTQAQYDYRVLQPWEVTDNNDNRSAFTFTPLGLLERTAIMGKTAKNQGDTLAAPGSQLFYDFMAFVERGQPISVRTVQRVQHVNAVDVPLPLRHPG